MKVLWFTNTPANGAEVLEGCGVYGGWLSALDRALNGKIELSVAFYFTRYAKSFIHKGVRYYPICKKNWKIDIIKKYLLNNLMEKEDLNLYIDIIKQVQPEIIHIHGTENPFCCIIDKVNIPIVLSHQGSYTVVNYKYFSGIEKEYASFSGRSLISPYSLIFNKSFFQLFKYSSTPKTKREKRYLAKCKHIIGRTDWARRITRILAPLSTYYHNDEILRDTFYNVEWRKKSNDVLIIHSTTGNGIFKGFETICYSLSELNRIDRNVEWRIAGISQDSLIYKVVKKKLKDLFPKKGLYLLGVLNEQDLVKRMVEADIYVMPSHIEDSPNGLCEAMMLGMPVVSTLAGGSSTLLKDKEEGIIIQDGDPWSMSGAILELADNPEIAIKYGQNARRKALERHNKEKIVSELIEIYKLIITQP